MILDLDNKLISGIDTSATTSANPFINNTRSGISSIILGFWTAKYRWTEANNAKDTSDNVFLAASFQKSTAILANALQTFRSVFIAPFVVNPAIKKRVHQVENAISNVQDIVAQVLEALAA